MEDSDQGLLLLLVEQLDRLNKMTLTLGHTILSLTHAMERQSDVINILDDRIKLLEQRKYN